MKSNACSMVFVALERGHQPNDFFIDKAKHDIQELEKQLAELQQAAREYMGLSEAVTIHSDYCAFCDEDIASVDHQPDCKFRIAEDKLHALLNPVTKP